MTPRLGQASLQVLPDATHVHAENAPALKFRFVDSETNARIDPDVLIVDNADFTSLVSNGQMELPTEMKSYMVTVLKADYEPMEEIFIEPSTGGWTEFRLYPSYLIDEPDKYGTPAFAKDAGQVVGYVRDRATGTPLADATVSLVGKGLEATVDESGYFELPYFVVDQTAEFPGQAGVDIDTLRITADGYVAEEREYVHLFGGDEIRYLINLDAVDPALNGAGVNFVRTIDERLNRAGAAARPDLKTPNPPAVRTGTPEELGSDDPALQAPPVIDSKNKVTGIRSHTIRVGTNCSCRTCSSVTVLNLQEYVKRSLPREWLASWHQNSLKAGAVAVRSYSGSFIVSPISSRYDICDNTCCQVFGSSTSASTNAATDATNGLYIVRGPVHGGTPFRSEFSSENNMGPPCRTDCFTGRSGSGPCLNDPPCCGFPLNGHGRGMCQFGTQRWAIGAARTGGAKSYVWISEHYYPNNPGYSGQNIRLGHW
jgi:hypothetical protein